MTVQRMGVGQRMSQAVVHNGTVYLAGVVAEDRKGCSVVEQTEQVLARIDQLLGEVGSDKTKLLRANIWLRDIANFDEMNSVWDRWVVPHQTPARACVESRMAAPDILVEIEVTAAIDS